MRRLAIWLATVFACLCLFEAAKAQSILYVYDSCHCSGGCGPNGIGCTKFSEVLSDEGYDITLSDEIPTADSLSTWDAVIVQSYGACNSGTASFLRDYLAGGGGLILLTGTPYELVGSTILTPIAEWFGASGYVNASGSAYYVDSPAPFEPQLSDNVYLSGITGSGAAILNLTDTTHMVGRWGTGTACFSFWNTFGAGKMFYLSSAFHTSSDEPNNEQLLIAGLAWASGKTHGGPVWYVDTAGSDSTGDGSELLPFKTVQYAIDRTIDGDTVLVADGTYTGSGNRDISFGGKNIVLMSENGPEVTIIDCQASGSAMHRGIIFESGETSLAEVVGLTIRNGYAPDHPDVGISKGGAILCISASPSFRDCVFESCYARSGGAVYCSAASPTFVACSFIADTSFFSGGGMFCNTGSSPLLDSCVFIDNSSHEGGGIGCENQSSPTIDRTLFVGNSADEGGAVWCRNESSPLLTNCSIVHCSASSIGAGITSLTNSIPSIVNSIISFSTNGEAVYSEGGTPVLFCSDIFGNLGGDWVGDIAGQLDINGNINADPLFCDTAVGDYKIRDISPCAPGNNSCSTLIGALGVACYTSTVVSTSPSQNKLNVNASADVSVTFDLDMDAATINDSTLVVHGQTTGLYTGTYYYDSPSRTATFDPDYDFAVGEVITVTVTSLLQTDEGVAISSAYSWSFTVGASTGTAVFTNRTDYATGDGTGAVYVAHLNNDEYLDIVAANYHSDDISILLGNGDGTFGYGAGLTTGDHPIRLFCADFDSDGDIDIASANYLSHNVSVFLNNGDATFGIQVLYSAENRPWSIDGADFDGDGDCDLVVANIWGNDVSVLLNSGDGSFSNGGSLPTGSYPGVVEIGDLDNDGDFDLAVGNTQSNNISVLFNQGNATFVPQTAYPVTDGPYSVLAADLNNDSYLDLAAPVDVSDDISILLNLGDGTFGSQSTYPTGDWPFSVCAADLNGDGYLDLAVPNDQSHNVSVLLNLGDGTFGTQSVFSAGEGCRSIFAADLNADGALDLVTANETGDNITVLLNGICVDSDGDGFGDLDHPENTCQTDNCPAIANPDQTDADGDGFGEACDCNDSDSLINPNTTWYADTDSDGYGNPDVSLVECLQPTGYVLDGTDCDDTNDKLSPETVWYEDSDGDGLGDATLADTVCEQPVGYVGSGTDNCVNIYNPTQDDLDFDFIGDACDSCTDSDGDGYGNPGFAANTCEVDNCPAIANPGQEDANGDGTGDACCCIGTTGNVDCEGIIDIGDVTMMIQNLFITLNDPCCGEEANVDRWGVIDIGDLSMLITSLFITLSPLPECP